MADPAAAPDTEDLDPFEGPGQGPEISQGEVPLLERMRLHFTQGQVREAPFGAARHFELTGIERGARTRQDLGQSPSDLENAAINEAVKTREDLGQYDIMPGASGFLEYGAAVIGRVAGNIADPTTVLNAPAKATAWAGRGIASVASKFGFGEATGQTAARIGEFGVNQAIINTATDPIVQGINIATADGTRETYDPFQTFIEAPLAGFVGGALLKGAHEAGSALFVKSAVEKDAYTFLKGMRDAAGPDEQAKFPEYAQAVSGKSDAELMQMAGEIAKADREAANPKTAADRPAIDITDHVGETTIDVNGKRTIIRDGEVVTEPRSAEPLGTTQKRIGDAPELAPAESIEPVKFETPAGTSRKGEFYKTPIRDSEGKDVGSLTYQVDELGPQDKTIRIRGANVAEANRGQGLGVEAYQELADRALASGRQLWSDRGVSSEAQHIYEALERRGYRVVKDEAPAWNGAAYKVIEGPRAETAIGDNLAASYHANEGTLAMAMTGLEGSLPRPPEVKPSARSTVSTNVEAPNIRKMWQDLATALGATVRQGRMGNKKAAGEFGLTSGVIRMKNIDDSVVLAHEVGHHLEFTDKDVKALIAAGNELDNMTGYAASHADPAVKRSEGFAEYFRIFLEHPEEAARRAPTFDAEFRAMVDAKPEMKAALEKAQAGFEAYRIAFAEDIIDANIATSQAPKGWQELKNDVRNHGFWNTIADRGSQVYTGLIDENNALANSVRFLLKTQKGNTGGGNVVELHAADDPYKLIRLSSRAHQAGMIDLMHGVTPYHSITPEGPGLHDAIALATGKPNILSGWDEEAVGKFSGYLIARRAVFEWDRRAAGELDKDPAPFPRDMYQTKIEVYERDNPNAKQAADLVYQWTQNLLKKEFEAGLLKRDAYDAALKIKDYVPFMRDMTDRTGGAAGQGGGASFDAGQVGLKQFKGSSRPIIDPIESLMERSFRTAQLIAHNDAIKALSGLAEKAGIGGGKIAERVPAHELKATYVDPLEAMRKGLVENGASKEDADLAISSMMDDLKINGQAIGPVSIFRSEQASARGENLVFYLEGGEMKALRLTSGEFGRQIVDTLTGGMPSQLRDWNLSGMQKLATALRAGITSSPDFFITNLIRDQLSTWIVNRGTIPFLDATRGIYREIANTDLARAYSQVGGIAGGANVGMLDHARIDKEIDSLAHKGFDVRRLATFEGYFKAVELSETGTRLGLFGKAYEKARKQGLNEYDAAVEAAFTATDNMDFGRHGSRFVATMKIVPFLNASLQGLDKTLYRTLIQPAFRESLTKGDVEAKKTMVSGYAKIAALTGLSMALRAAYIDDPEYSELSDYLRNTHWVVKVPGSKGGTVTDPLGRTLDVPPGLRSTWLAIPKPFELAILPNMGERAVEMLALQDPKALSRWAWGALDLATPRTIADATGAKLFFELKSGKDFFSGRDIVPEAVRGREPWLQSTAATSEFSKAIGGGIDKIERGLGFEGGGISPMYIDHLIQGVAGSWGRTFLSLSDYVIGTKGDKSLADTAITRRVFKEAYRGSTSVQEFWSQVSRETGKLKQAATTYDALLSNPAEAASYVARLAPDTRAFVIMNKSAFDADEKRLHPLARAESAIGAINQITKEIANRNLVGSADREPIVLTGSQQRVALDALSRIRMWEARNSLITAGNENLAGQKPGNVQAEIDMLMQTVPEVYDELVQRYANAKVYKADAVARNWQQVRQAVIDDGSDASLGVYVKDVQRDGYELGGKREKAKKVRPSIPGLNATP